MVVGGLGRSLISVRKAVAINAISSLFYMFSFGLVVPTAVFFFLSKGFSKEHAYILFSAFFSLYFSLTIICGVIGQKYSYKWSCAIGTFLMVSGLLALTTLSHSFVGYGAYAVGCSLFYPNKAVCMGQIFDSHDSKRSSAFTFSYFIMNFGALVGGAISGVTINALGFSWLFLFASFSSLISGFLFLYFLNKFPFIKTSQCFLQLCQRVCFLKHVRYMLIIVSLVTLSIVLMAYPNFDDELIILIGVLIAIYLIAWSMVSKRLNILEKNNMRKFVFFLLIMALFWVVYDFEPTALLVFIKNHVDRVVFGVTIPPSVFFSLDPGSVFILGGLVYLLFREKLIQRVPTRCKLLLGLSFAVMALFLLTFCIYQAYNQHTISVLLIILIYLIVAAGEIFVGPTANAMVGELAPMNCHGFFMGCSQFVSGFAATISGLLAADAIRYSKAGDLTISSFKHYATYSVAGLVLVIILVGISVLRRRS